MSVSKILLKVRDLEILLLRDDHRFSQSVIW